MCCLCCVVVKIKPVCLRHASTSQLFFMYVCIFACPHEARESVRSFEFGGRDSAATWTNLTISSYFSFRSPATDLPLCESQNILGRVEMMWWGCCTSSFKVVFLHLRRYPASTFGIYFEKDRVGVTNGSFFRQVSCRYNLDVCLPYPSFFCIAL